MKKLKICLWSLALTAILLSGCSFPGSKAQGNAAEHSITLMTWNVHNLFDGKDNGNEYIEFRESAGWSVEKYLGRINSISAAIGSLNPLPDIILFQEIESEKILEDIALSIGGGYLYCHFANNPDASLGLGILSRIPLEENSIHSISINYETTPRPVLETRINFAEGAFVIFSCHWKSKTGGDDATENLRKASARVILRRIRELWEYEPELGIIVAGDLNVNHDEFYRRSGSIVYALLSDDPGCAQLAGFPDNGRQTDFIIVSGDKPPVPVHFPLGSITLYSPWMHELENGSYFYRNSWEAIDHFLISDHFFGSTGWRYDSAAVINDPPFANNEGKPAAYNVRTGADLSDHLPLLLTLKMAGNIQLPKS